MIELRYIHVEDSDHRSLQYRFKLTIEEALPSREWSKWKFIPGIIFTMKEYEQMQKECTGND